MNKRSFIDWINNRLLQDFSVSTCKGYQTIKEIIDFAQENDIHPKFADIVLDNRLDTDFLIIVANQVKNGVLDGKDHTPLLDILKKRRERRIEYRTYKVFLIGGKRCVNVNMLSGTYSCGSFVIPVDSAIGNNAQSLLEAEEDPDVDYMLCVQHSKFYGTKAVYVYVDNQVSFYPIVPPVHTFPVSENMRPENWTACLVRRTI